MLPKKEIKTGLDDILKAVTETHRRGYNQPPTGYNQVNQPQPQGGELHRFPSLAMSRLSSRRDGELANMRYQAKNEPKPR